ncbi:hypothetical protein ACRQ1B_28525 [Rhizobium panacihumi]|uniref:hypothetical protein n=1 Tax=Rhizobium panacihumi TaxID=2008450 RepID=UPI003D7AC6C6
MQFALSNREIPLIQGFPNKGVYALVFAQGSIISGHWFNDMAEFTQSRGWLKRTYTEAQHFIITEFDGRWFDLLWIESDLAPLI